MPRISELVRRVIVVSEALIERSPEHTERVLKRLHQMEQEIEQNLPGHPSLAQIGAVIETLSAAHAQNTSRPDFTDVRMRLSDCVPLRGVTPRAVPDAFR
jgi:ABC-type nitrate/sulfonate/bicarbonate transport system substrate-binding protein